MNNFIKWQNNKEKEYDRDDNMKHVAERHKPNNWNLKEHHKRELKKFFRKVVDRVK